MTSFIAEDESNSRQHSRVNRRGNLVMCYDHRLCELGGAFNVAFFSFIGFSFYVACYWFMFRVSRFMF
jgi:hypothetical protein